MTLRDLRTVGRVIGRRTTLRYLAVGVAASLLAACSGEGPTSPTGNALAAFLRGEWSVRSTLSSGETASSSLSVDASSWRLSHDGAELRGTWEVRSGRLEVRPDDEDTTYRAENLPEQVTGQIAVMVPWSATGPDGQQLDLSYDDVAGTLRVRHLDGDRVTTHDCTRL